MLSTLNKMTELFLSKLISADPDSTFMEHFRETGATVNGVQTHCFKHFFNAEGNPVPEATPFVGELSVGERDGDPYDALAFFFTDDKVEPSLSMFMWGVIESGPGGPRVWRLPTTTEEPPLVVTGNVTNDDPPPGGPDRVGIRIEFGKKKSKEACLGGIPNQPWQIVITLNTLN